jgi:1,4-alpha-glucan branching enzyme
LYQTEPALYLEEHNPDRFRWLMVDNRNDNVYAFERKINNSSIIIVLNMKGNYYNEYDIGVFEPGIYQEILNTDNEIYSGWHRLNQKPISTQSKSGPEGRPFTLTLAVGSFAVIVLKKISEIAK